MDKNTEIGLIRDDKGRLVKGTPPGPGRPKGSENFATKWERMVKKIADQNNLTPDEIDEQLLLVGYKKAKDGDYSFYRDAMDRIHGKAPQVVDFKGDITVNDGLTTEQKEALLNLLK